MEREYKFYAFISYKRGGKDEKYAAWLQRRLEAYRIPVGISIPDTPKRLKVFRDKTDLGSHTSLDQGLNQNLENSRCLLLVCSPRSADSPFVESEVHHFVEHRGVESIVPFIIDGTPTPSAGEPSCYPPSLPATLLGVTLSDGTREEALIKSLARLLNVDYTDLYRRHLRSQRRFMMRVLTGVLAVLMLLAGLTVWALLAEKRAETQRIEAEELVRFLVFDMEEEIFDYVPLKTRVTISEKVQNYYDKWGMENENARFSRIRHLMNQATTALMTSDGTKSQRLRFEALFLMEDLYAENLDNVNYFETYIQLLHQVGDLVGKKDRSASKEYFLKSIETARSFLLRNINNPVGQVQLANSLEGMASKFLSEGKANDAKPLFEECLSIWQKLYQVFPQMATDPYYTEKQALRLSTQKQILIAEERWEEAAGVSENVCVLFERLYNENPNNLSILFNYGHELDDVTLLQMRLGHLVSADVNHSTAMRVKKILLASDPENIFSQYQLATTLSWGGVLRNEQKRKDEALTFFEEAQRVLRPLLEAEPEHPTYLSMNALILQNLSWLGAKTNGGNAE